MAHSALKYLSHCVWDCVQKCIRIIDGAETQAYLKKIEACNLLRLLAMRLQEVADLLFGYMHRQVIKCLENAQGDRVLKVRQAALLAKQQWLQVKVINEDLEGKKTNQELRGLSPDQLIKARTGFGDMEELRQSILEEAEKPTGHSEERKRPQTADASRTPPKKFKMLRELARLNQELRVQKPYQPTLEEKRRQERGLSAAARSGKQFLKRGGGIGGGNMPAMDIVKSSKQERPRSSQPKKGIRELIIDHLKGKIATEEDAHRYISGLNRKAPQVEVYDVLSKIRSEQAQ